MHNWLPIAPGTSLEGIRLLYFATTTILCHDFYTMPRLLYSATTTMPRLRYSATTTILCSHYCNLLRLLYYDTTTTLCYDCYALLRLLLYAKTAILCYDRYTLPMLEDYGFNFEDIIWKVRPALRRAGRTFFRVASFNTLIRSSGADLAPNLAPLCYGYCTMLRLL